MICRNCGSEHNNPQFCPVCNAVYETNQASDIKNHVDNSNTVFTLSVIALVLSTDVPIAGLILSCIAGSKLNNLPFVCEEELLPEILEQYYSSKTKIKIAKLFKNIALPVSIVNLILLSFYTISLLFYYVIMAAELFA